MENPLDRFLPETDVRERHEITVHAPPAIVMEAARTLSFRSIPLVRAIFWLRGRILGARPDSPEWSRGFVEEALAAGWVALHEESGRCLVAGASCRPWIPDGGFHPDPSRPLPRLQRARSREDRVDAPGQTLDRRRHPIHHRDPRDGDRHTGSREIPPLLAAFRRRDCVHSIAPSAGRAARGGAPVPIRRIPAAAMSRR